MSILTFRSKKTVPPACLLLEQLEDRTVPAVLDLTTMGAIGTINGATFEQADPQPTGVGVIQDFLRIQSNSNGVEQGYNSDARPVQFDEKSDHHTHAIQLSDLPTVNIGGVSYSVVLLGINQSQNGSNALLSLDELRIYVGNSPDVSGYNATTQQLGGLTAVYDMGANWVKLNSALSHGNGSGDMYLFVPDSLLTSPTGNSDPYIYFYSKFGVNYAANGGFEQWAPGKGAVAPPSSGGSSGSSSSIPATPPSPATLAGIVYFDANQNGVYDAGDTGIIGVTVTLTGTNYLGQSVTLTTTTAADGSYSFTGLMPGTYSLTETPPAGYLAGADSVGDVNSVTDGTLSQQYLITNILLQAGQSGVNYNFGEVYQPSSLS